MWIEPFLNPFKLPVDEQITKTGKYYLRSWIRKLYFLIVPVTFFSGVFSLVYLAIFETRFLAFIALKEQEETRGK